MAEMGWVEVLGSAALGVIILAFYAAFCLVCGSLLLPRCVQTGGWGVLYGPHHRSSTRTSFMLTDIYLLVFQLFISGLCIHKLASPNDAEILTALVYAHQLLFWFVGVRALSRNGAGSAIRRAVFLTISVPLAYGALPLIAFLRPETLAALFRDQIGFIGDDDQKIFYYAILGLVILFGTRIVSRWAVAPRTPGQSAPKLNAVAGH